MPTLHLNENTERLHSLFRDEWSRLINESATAAGLPVKKNYHDQSANPSAEFGLADLSFEAIERRKEHQREMLDRIRRIDRSELSEEDALSYDIFLRNKTLDVEGQNFPTELMPINQIESVQTELPQLILRNSFETVEDYEKYLQLLAAFPGYVDQLITLLKQGMETKWVMPAVAISSVPLQIKRRIVDDVTGNPLYRPFKEFPDNIPAAKRSHLSSAGQRTILEVINPAWEKLYSFIKETYLPSCRKEIGVSALPEGRAFYDYCVRLKTTTDLSSEEIHEIGWQEVARIHREMLSVIEQAGFKGSFQDFLLYLRTDPSFYYAQSGDLVSGYRDICKRADEMLPRFFSLLPRNTYGVREIPSAEAYMQAICYYTAGADDCSRAGTFWVNTQKLSTRPKYEMEVIALHEAVPGHHLQISRAQELKDLPLFRRHGQYVAYNEGWGVYAEKLGFEMGFYRDPYMKFGQLTYEMLRACRMVADTGIHTYNWSREKAILFLMKYVAKTRDDIIFEVDRYLVQPGEVLSYKIGELKFLELRSKTESELKDKFRIREFHNALLDSGALPLDILETRINDWITTQQ